MEHTPLTPDRAGNSATSHLIASQVDLDDLVRELQSVRRFAVDTEADAYFAYTSKVCLFQFSTEGGDYLVDPLVPLDFAGLGSVFASPEVEKVFHAAENDVGLLRAQFGFSFENIFDTMVAAQVLGYERCGLAALLDQFFQVTLEKKYQTSDWRERPLSQGQIDYAHADTRHLIALRDRLMRELERLQRVAEAEADFRRVAGVVLEQKTFDPNGFTRLRQARQLDPCQLRRLAELYLLRDAVARDWDRAPYRVFDDEMLMFLARRPPRDLEHLSAVRGLRPWKVERFGERLLAAIRAAEEKGPLAWPKRRYAGHRPPELTAVERRLLEALRQWRDDRAQQRGVAVSRIATTALLVQLTLEKPKSREALARLPGMDDWRVSEYGDEIVKVVLAAVA